MSDVNGRSQLSQTLHCGTAPDGPCGEYNGRTSGLATCTGCQTGYHEYTPGHRPHQDRRGDPLLPRRPADLGRAGEPGRRHRLEGRRAPRLLPAASTWPSAASTRTRVAGFTTPTAGHHLRRRAERRLGHRRPGDRHHAARDDRPGRPRPGRASCGSPARRATGSSRSTAQPYEVKGLTYGPPQARRRRLHARPEEHGRQHDPHLGRGRRATPRRCSTPGRAAGHQGDRRALAQPGRRLRQRHRVQERGQDRDRGPGQRAQEQPGRADVGRRQRGHPDHAGPRAAGRRGRGAAGRVRQVRQRGRAWRSTPPTRTTRSPRPTRTRTRGPTTRPHSPALDLLAVNSYGAIGGVKPDWIAGGYTKPYIVTEAGPDGEWEVPNDVNGVPTEPTDLQKRAGYTASWNAIKAHPGVALGATEFHYGLENDFGGVWLNTYHRRLAPARLPRAAAGLHRAAPRRTPRRRSPA